MIAAVQLHSFGHHDCTIVIIMSSFQALHEFIGVLLNGP